MRAIDDILDRLGVNAPSGGDLEVRTPITGETLAHVARTDAAGTDAAIARATAAFEQLARRPGSPPRRARAPVRRGAAPREGGAGRARHARDRQDRPGGPRRGPGDDRHLRPRGRSLAAAVRPHDRVGAAGASHARDLAPARPGRRDQRLQLPGRRVELELRARARVRRPRGVEAERAHAAHGARVPVAAAARGGGVRRHARRDCSRSSSAAPTARASWPRTRGSRSSPRPARRSWARRSRRSSPRASAVRCSSSAATTR